MGHRLTAPLDEALRLVDSDPRAALQVADCMLADANIDGGERAAAWWVRGLGLRDLARPHESLEAFVRAADLASLAGTSRLAARYRVSLSLALAHLGNFDQSLQTIDEALVELDGAEATTGYAQRALILQRAGRFDEALAGWDEAIPRFEETGDRHGQAIAYLNRGTTRVYLGLYRRAMTDMATAEACFRETGAVLRAAEAVHNRGFVAARLGDIPTALRLMDGAQQEMLEAGVVNPSALIDRVDALISAGLGREGLGVAEVAAGRLREAGLHSDLAELSLLASRGAEQAGDLHAARRWAEGAEAQFGAQDRPRWRVLARFAVRRVELRMHPSVAPDLAALRTELLRFGWADDAVDAALIEIRGVLSSDPAWARRVADDARRRTRSVSKTTRAKLWLAEALVCQAEGRNADAMRAVRTGVRLLEAVQAGLAAIDLRISASARIEDLAEVGAAIALSSGRVDRAFGWLERGRIGATWAPGMSLIPDGVIAASLEQLRRLRAQLEADGLTEVEAARQRRRVNAHEELVRRRLRHGISGGSLPPVPIPADQLMERLGDGHLIEFGAVNGDLVAVVAGAGRWRIASLGPVSDVATLVDTLRHALVEYVSHSKVMTAKVPALIAELTARADQLLFGTIGDLGGGELILVPAGPLHAMPWGVLPTLSSRPFVIAPTASTWAASSTVAIDHAPRVHVVAGPGLQHTDREMALVTSAYPEGVVACRDAGVAEVKAGVANSDVVHFACHGSFRPDNPQFSSLRLRDGPLSALELAGVARHPLLYVLSACDSGMSIAEGGGTLGVATLLLAAGARSVIASVTAADDEHTPELMAGLHRHLAAGRDAAQALALARADHPQPWLVAGFAVYGASVRVAGPVA